MTNPIFKLAAAIMWDPKTQTVSEAWKEPSEMESPAMETPPSDLPSPIEAETARINKLLEHAQARMQLIQTQQQTDAALDPNAQQEQQ